MMNRQKIGSEFRLGLFLAALLVVPGLSGCGSGESGDPAGASSDDPAAAAFARRPDTTAPTAPEQLSADPISSAQIDLTWSASTDNRRVAGYKVWRNGTALATLGTVTTFEDVGLAASTAYSYTVRAYDAAGNFSAASTTAAATTLRADATAPLVSSTSPANFATGIAVNSAITVNFSGVMLASSLNANTFSVIASGGVPIDGAVSITGNTATFTPSNALPAATKFTAILAKDAKDSAGNPLGADYVWYFTTGAAIDTKAPTVLSTFPANASTNVSVNTSISVTFSEAMKNSTLSTSSFTVKRTTDSVAVLGAVKVSGNTATFTPSAPRMGSTQYTATITTAVQDAAGNAVAASSAWSFTTAATADTTPPTVSTVSPANLATGVALNSPVSVTFSEPMTNSTLTTASFMLARTGGAAVSGTVTVAGSVATFTPSADLAPNTPYTATVTTAAKDAAGNAMTANFTSSFTTSAAGLSATLTWGPVTAANVSGYRIYYGTSPGAYLQALGQGLNVGEVTTYTVMGLSSRTRYYFAVTAVDASNGESPYSNETSKDIP